MTNREAIYRIRDLFKESHADSLLSDKLIFSILDTHRKWLINRDSNKLRLIKKDSMYQTWKCVPLIDVPKVDPCCGISTKCKIKRTKDKLPPIMEDDYGAIIKAVTSFDNESISFTPIKFSEVERKSKNPWINEKSLTNSFYYYMDGYLYFPWSTLKGVNVFGMYKSDISEFNVYCLKKKSLDIEPLCIKFLDRKFIIPDYLEAQVMEYTKADIMNIFKQIPDKTRELDKNDNT